jgi:putative ABC transport system substrate-binding protein
VITRRRLIQALSGGVLAAPLAAAAQGTRRVPTVGVLSPTPTGANPVSEAFAEKLQQLGWLPGQTIRIEQRYSGGRQETLAPLVADLIRLGPDVLVAWSPSAAIAAKAATTRIPVVFLAAGNPVAFQLVSNLARPEANVTGVSFDASIETYPKAIQILKEFVPSVSRLAILTGPDQTGAVIQLLRDAARGLKVEAFELRIRTSEEIVPTIRKAKEQGAQALQILPSGLAFALAKDFAGEALAQRLPSIHPFQEGALAGGLLSYSPSLVAIARRGAEYVDRILRGTKPSDLPVEQPSTLELIINLKTAKLLRLTIPPALLVRADRIIE